MHAVKLNILVIFFYRNSNLNANYRRNHNFHVGHNWQNRQTNLGYTWNFGKRRRSTDVQNEVLELLKIEREVRLHIFYPLLFIIHVISSSDYINSLVK